MSIEVSTSRTLEVFKTKKRRVPLHVVAKLNKRGRPSGKKIAADGDDGGAALSHTLFTLSTNIFLEMF